MTSGVAVTATISCPNRDGNLCVGTSDADAINVVSNFSLTGDTIDGNPGPNYIKSTGVAGVSAGGTDSVSAGGSDDWVDVDDGAPGDTVSNCETRVQDGVVQP